MIDKNQSGVSTTCNSLPDATSVCLIVDRLRGHFIVAFFLVVAVDDSVVL